MNIINKIQSLFKKEDEKKEEDRAEIAKELDRKQAIVNAEYERDGLTDSVLEKQLEINQKRNEWDIPDKTKLTDSNKGFVQ